jgi:hypothetical protein
MKDKKLEEANKKFERQRPKKSNQSDQQEEEEREGMKGKDLRKNLGCG